MKLGDLFDCWSTIPEMADDLGVSHWVVSKWRQRGRIPASHWGSVVSAASRKGKKLSADDLLVMHSRRNGSSLRAPR